MLLGSSVISVVVTDRFDFMEWRGGSFLWSCFELIDVLALSEPNEPRWSELFLKGSAGMLLGSYGGALTLQLPMEAAPAAAPERPTPVDRADIDDIVEDIDSFDAFLLD